MVGEKLGEFRGVVNPKTRWDAITAHAPLIASTARYCRASCGRTSRQEEHAMSRLSFARLAVIAFTVCALPLLGFGGPPDTAIVQFGQPDTGSQFPPSPQHDQR